MPSRFFMLRTAVDEAMTQRLRALPYDAFLKTEYWRIVREFILERDPICTSCGRKSATHCHHLRYRVGQEHLYPEDLAGLCRDCHDALQPLGADLDSIGDIVGSVGDVLGRGY